MKFQTFIKDIIGNICWEFQWICSLLAWMTARHLEGMLLISLPSRGLSELIFFRSFVIAFFSYVEFSHLCFATLSFRIPHTFSIGQTSENFGHWTWWSSLLSKLRETASSATWQRWMDAGSLPVGPCGFHQAFAFCICGRVWHCFGVIFFLLNYN